MYKVRIRPDIFKATHFSLKDININREMEVTYKDFYEPDSVHFPRKAVELRSRLLLMAVFYEPGTLSCGGDRNLRAEQSCAVIVEDPNGKAKVTVEDPAPMNDAVRVVIE